MHEIDLIQRWVAGGAPEGDPARSASAADVGRGLAAREAGSRGHVAGAVHACRPRARIFRAPSSCRCRSARSRYVSGIEFRPGQFSGGAPREHPDRSHASDRAGSMTRIRRPGTRVCCCRRRSTRTAIFSAGRPGRSRRFCRVALAWTLTPGTDLVVEIHFVPRGKPEVVQPSIGLFFTDEPPERTPAMLRLGRQNIDIAAGQEGLRHHRFVRAAGRRRGAGGAAARALPRARSHEAPPRCRTARRSRSSTSRTGTSSGSTCTGTSTPMALPKGTTLAMRYHLRQLGRQLREPRISRPHACTGVSSPPTRWATCGFRC